MQKYGVQIQAWPEKKNLVLEEDATIFDGERHGSSSQESSKQNYFRTGESLSLLPNIISMIPCPEQLCPYSSIPNCSIDGFRRTPVCNET